MASKAVGKDTNIAIDCIDRVDHCGNWNPRSAEQSITGVIVVLWEHRAIDHRSDCESTWESITGVVKGIDFVSQHLNHRSDPTNLQEYQ